MRVNAAGDFHCFSNSTAPFGLFLRQRFCRFSQLISFEKLVNVSSSRRFFQLEQVLGCSPAGCPAFQTVKAAAISCTTVINLTFGRAVCARFSLRPSRLGDVRIFRAEDLCQAPPEVVLNFDYPVMNWVLLRLLRAHPRPRVCVAASAWRYEVAPRSDRANDTSLYQIMGFRVVGRTVYRPMSAIAS